MGRPIIECVPNFSEGRRQHVIEAIVAPFRNRPGCSLIDYRADKDHNRLVVSLVGAPDPIQEALVEAALVARNEINLEEHQGAHPRMGAVDVIPFVPLRNITMDECVNLARDFGRRYHDQTGIPVYFYEEAALRPERKRLEIVRKGQFEALKIEAGAEERRPDVGPAAVHPTAGATVIGARKFLIAFNVNLNTSNLNVAREIARAVRNSSGGFTHVKGAGIALEERGLVQVSMNLVDFEKNPMYRVLETIRMEARRWGVEVLETEIYGLVPMEALVASAAYYLQVTGFDSKQIIELSLLDDDSGSGS